MSIDLQKYDLLEKETAERSKIDGDLIIVIKTITTIYKRKPENNDGFVTPQNNFHESKTSDDSETPSKQRRQNNAGTVCDAVSEVSSFDIDKFINENSDIHNQNLQDTPKVQSRNRSFKIPKMPVKIDPKEKATLRAKSTEIPEPIQRNVNKKKEKERKRGRPKGSQEVRDLEEGQKWHNRYVVDGTPSRGLRLRKRHSQKKVRKLIA